MKMSKSDIRHILLSVLFAVFALSVAAVCLLQAKTLAAFAQDEQAGATEKSVDVSMTLNDNLIVNFAVPEDAGASASVAFNGKDYTLQGTLTDGKYKFSFDGVTPQYMTQAITFTAGEYTLSKPLSVQTYCEGLLSGTAEELGIGSLEYAVLRELATDILNYGAAAQTYLQMDAESLPNANVDQSLATVYDLTPTSPSVDNEGEVKWYSAGMVCGSKPSLYVRIVLPEGKTADAYTVKADSDAAEYQRTETVNGMQVATYYYDSLSVLEFYKDMNLTVWEGETQEVSGTLSYSVHDYISAMADSSTAGTSDLVKALYGYGKAAVAYANADKFNQYTIDADAGTVSRAYDDGNYRWAYPVANVNEDLTIVGSDVTLSVTGSGAATVGDITIEATDSFTFAAGTLNSGHIDTTAPENTIGAGATLNVTTDGTTNGFNAENVCLTVNGGSVSAAAGVQIGTLRMRGGSLVLDGQRASYRIQNFELAGGSARFENTLCTDKLVVKSGELNVNVHQEFGYDPGGITTYSDTEGQRYYFLGGTTVVNREQADGGKGAAGFFFNATGEQIAVVIAGKASVQVTGGFDYVFFFNQVARGEVYEYTKNAAHNPGEASDIDEIAGLKYDIVGTNVDNQPGGGDLWNNVVNNVAYWQAICNINGTNELQNQSLEGKFLGDVNFETL